MQIARNRVELPTLRLFGQSFQHGGYVAGDTVGALPQDLLALLRRCCVEQGLNQLQGRARTFAQQLKALVERVRRREMVVLPQLVNVGCELIQCVLRAEHGVCLPDSTDAFGALGFHQRSQRNR